MKKSGHPQYQEVVFVDSSTGKRFVCGTTLQTEHKEKFHGKEMPVVAVSLSSASHPFFVGGNQLVDTEGRVDKFKKRYQAVKAPVKTEKEPEELIKTVKAKKAPAKKKTKE